MATTDASGSKPDVDAARSLAAELGEASFAHLLVADDGDAIAAGGLLGQALERRGTPFQVSVVSTPSAANRRVDAMDSDVTPVGIGVQVPDESANIDGVPRCRDAYEAVVELLDSEPATPRLALAGAVAGGAGPEAIPAAMESLRGQGAETVPGVGVPTTDFVTGLAYTTRVHASFSGDPETVESTFGGVIEDVPGGGRELGSAVALAVAGPDEIPSQAADTTQSFIHPLTIDGPYTTVSGFGDVLAGAARMKPGAAIAVALDRGGPDAVLEAWRHHGTTVHEAVRTVTLQRYTGLTVAAVDAPVVGTARLLRDFRSPEPAVLVTDGTEAALATSDADATQCLGEATDPSQVMGRPRLARTQRLEDDLPTRLREVL